MLHQLTITNFAIIDRLELSLAPGLNVLTGETGAGKSIVVDAVSSLLGSRLGPEFIRTGADQAHVEGIFEAPVEPPLADLLTQHDLAGDDDSIIISRSLNRSGRSVARVNGRAVPLALLQQIGRHLIDIHGQSEHLSLLRVAEHVDFLDGYAGARELRAQVAAKVAALRGLRRELDQLLRDERELARRADLLRFQVDEINSARLRPDEEEELRRERHLLANAKRLAADADAVYKLLYAGTENTRSVTDLLGEVAIHLAELARLDPSMEAHAQVVEESTYELEDVARELRAYRDQVEHNPERLEAVEERIELINGLKRKYGSTIPEILQFAERAAAELDGLGHREERVADLRERERECLAELSQAAERLSAERQAAASRLSSEVARELADLSLAQVRFRVDLRREASPDGVPLSDGRTYACDSTGVDRVEFMIAPNPGEPEKPLARIASGGETSRLMLALKTILARVGVVPVLIFDEIDVGIGGRSGHVVGQKLAGLARERQVICITHLPQIACFADAHYNIAKQVRGGRTTTGITALAGQDRVEELAAMLGGAEGSERARANARELLERAEAWKRGRDHDGRGEDHQVPLSPHPEQAGMPEARPSGRRDGGGRGRRPRAAPDEAGRSRQAGASEDGELIGLAGVAPEAIGNDGIEQADG